MDRAANAIWRPPVAVQAYTDLLAAVGAAGLPPDAQMTSHWPLIGAASNRLLIVGQAVFGWIPNWRPRDIASEAGRHRVLQMTQEVCHERSDPMDWIIDNRARNSPFWRCVRGLVELRWGTQTNWYSHVAWANIYPIARNDIKGNPEGILRESQRPHAAKWLTSVADAIQPDAVVVLGGGYWWDVASEINLTQFAAVDRPLLVAGSRAGLEWVAGWHPAGAQRRGWNADKYAKCINEVLDVPRRP